MRIGAILSLIEPCGHLADIGCDHGMVSKAVLDANLATRVTLADISETCLKKARKLLGGDPRAEFVVSDGFCAIDAYVDTAVITGMGGRTIEAILAPYPYKPTLVLGPQRDTTRLRRYLTGNGYRIEKERYILADKRWYTLILAKEGGQELSEVQAHLGAYCYVKDAECAAYLTAQHQAYSKYPPTDKNKTILRYIEEALSWQA